MDKDSIFELQKIDSNCNDCKFMVRDMEKRKSFDHLHENMGGVGDQDRADRGPPDDHQLGRLQQHSQLTMLHQIAADHGSEDHHDSDDDEHAISVSILANVRK